MTEPFSGSLSSVFINEHVTAQTQPTFTHSISQKLSQSRQRLKRQGEQCNSHMPLMAPIIFHPTKKHNTLSFKRHCVVCCLSRYSPSYLNNGRRPEMRCYRPMCCCLLVNRGTLPFGPHPLLLPSKFGKAPFLQVSRLVQLDQLFYHAALWSRNYTYDIRIFGSFHCIIVFDPCIAVCRWLHTEQKCNFSQLAFIIVPTRGPLSRLIYFFHKEMAGDPRSLVTSPNYLAVVVPGSLHAKNPFILIEFVRQANSLSKTEKQLRFFPPQFSTASFSLFILAILGRLHQLPSRTKSVGLL